MNSHGRLSVRRPIRAIVPQRSAHTTHPCRIAIDAQDGLFTAHVCTSHIATAPSGAFATLTHTDRFPCSAQFSQDHTPTDPAARASDTDSVDDTMATLLTRVADFESRVTAACEQLSAFSSTTFAPSSLRGPALDTAMLKAWRANALGLHRLTAHNSVVRECEQRIDPRTASDRYRDIPALARLHGCAAMLHGCISNVLDMRGGRFSVGFEVAEFEMDGALNLLPVTETGVANYQAALPRLQDNIPVINAFNALLGPIIDTLNDLVEESVNAHAVGPLPPVWNRLQSTGSRVRAADRLAAIILTRPKGSLHAFDLFRRPVDRERIVHYDAMLAVERYLATYCRQRAASPMHTMSLAQWWDAASFQLITQILATKGVESQLRALDRALRNFVRDLCTTPVDTLPALCDEIASLYAFSLRTIPAIYRACWQHLAPADTTPRGAAMRAGLRRILAIGTSEEQRTTLLSEVRSESTSPIPDSTLEIFAQIGDGTLSIGNATALVTALRTTRDRLSETTLDVATLARRTVIDREFAAATTLGMALYHAERGGHVHLDRIITLPTPPPTTLLHMRIENHTSARTIRVVDLSTKAAWQAWLDHPEYLERALRESAEPPTELQLIFPHHELLDPLLHMTELQTALAAALRSMLAIAPTSIVAWQEDRGLPLFFHQVAELAPDALCPALRPPPAPRLSTSVPSDFPDAARPIITHIATALRAKERTLHNIFSDVWNFLRAVQTVHHVLLRDADQRAWFFDGAPTVSELFVGALDTLATQINTRRMPDVFPLLQRLLQADDDAALSVLGLYSRLRRGTLTESALHTLLRTGQTLLQQHPGVIRTPFLSLLDGALRGRRGEAAELGYIVARVRGGVEIEALNPSRVLAQHERLTCDFIETVDGEPCLVELKSFELQGTWAEQVAWIGNHAHHGFEQLRESSVRYGGPVQTRLVLLFPNLAQQMLIDVRAPRATLQPNLQDVRAICDRATTELEQFELPGTLVLGTYRAHPQEDPAWFDVLHLAPFAVE